MKHTVIIALVLALSACAAQHAAVYSAELELCLQTSQTCEQYTQCRAGVAAKNGRSFDGGCAKDTGGDQ